MTRTNLSPVPESIITPPARAASYPERARRTSKLTLTEFRLALQAKTWTNRAGFRRILDFGEPQA
jgi:hypothetical protein